MHSLTKKQKNSLWRIIIATAVLVMAIVFGHTLKEGSLWKNILYFIAYLTVGYDVIVSALKGFVRGRLMDEKFLMLTATVGAFVLSEYAESVAVMLFYQVGELFQGYAVGKSRRRISELMDICPEYANVESESGLKRVSPEEICPGDTVVVRQGERIPVDGLIVEGSSFIDTSSITGESLSKEVLTGEKVISGCINMSSLLKIKAEKTFEESTASKILELIEEASFNKSKSENFISRFARVYTPAVVICAFLVFLVGAIATSQYVLWLQRALIFLVVSCPCALVISIPLSFFASIGCGSKNGILIKGSNRIEVLANAKTVVFDKTGTLTKGNFVITKIFTSGNCSSGELLEMACACEYYSIHPIAGAIKEADVTIDVDEISGFESFPGLGVRAEYKGKNIFCGSEKYIKKYVREPFEHTDSSLTTVHICADGEYMGYISIADEIKTNAHLSIKQLKSLGIECVMFTGDKRSVSENTAKLTGCDTVRYELLPADKTRCFASLKEDRKGKGSVAFVGDGINDAPVITLSDVGIAMGSAGSDAAIEAADVVIMNDDIAKIPLSVKLCRKTMAIVKQNTVFSIGVKLAVMILATFGLANMWLAVFADVGVAVLAILNAFRAFSVKM